MQYLLCDIKTHHVEMILDDAVRLARSAMQASACSDADNKAIRDIIKSKVEALYDMLCQKAVD